MAFLVSTWILAILSSFLFIFSVLRSFKTSGSKIYIKVFYGLVCFQILFNSSVFWVIIIIDNIPESVKRQLILIPSIFMLLTYYTLYLILFDQMISSRVSVSNSYKTKLEGNCVIKTIQTVGFFLIFGLIIVNIIFLIFSMSNHVDNEQDLFDKMFLATFGFVPFWFVVSILVIYCRLSGKPFKSKQEYDNTKYISIIFMLWTAAFLVKIIIYMIFAHGDQT